MNKYFEYSHTVSFEETNLVGNVYFVNYFKWQGRCREMFLKEKAGNVIVDIEAGRLALITLHSACNFLGELKAFDQLRVQMFLEGVNNHKIKMKFNYYKVAGEELQLVATGVHEAGCFEKTSAGLAPVVVPILMNALNNY
jgi:enediyne core biosynthesis thioesterase